MMRQVNTRRHRAVRAAAFKLPATAVHARYARQGTKRDLGMWYQREVNRCEHHKYMVRPPLCNVRVLCTMSYRATDVDRCTTTGTIPAMYYLNIMRIADLLQVCRQMPWWSWASRERTLMAPRIDGVRAGSPDAAPFRAPRHFLGRRGGADNLKLMLHVQHQSHLLFVMLHCFAQRLRA